MAQACLLWNCAPILEARLLPKLDTHTQLRLAATSQGLRQWLLALPPSYWQASILLPHLSKREHTMLLPALCIHLLVEIWTPCSDGSSVGLRCQVLWGPGQQGRVQPTSICRCFECLK